MTASSCVVFAGEIFAIIEKVAFGDPHVKHFTDAHVKMQRNYHLKFVFYNFIFQFCVACEIIEHFSRSFSFYVLHTFFALVYE